ncbi:MAG: type II toxin-antitoxin system RelE/ParE family toxin [Asticcacaulis sp.]
MSHLIFTPGAARDLERCRTFLHEKSPLTARRAVQAILQKIETLVSFPGVGRPSRLRGYRELVVDFGDSGYIVRYLYNANQDTVRIAAIWHQREAG